MNLIWEISWESIPKRLSNKNEAGKGTETTKNLLHSKEKHRKPTEENI